jgi:hypothetical protein
LSFLVKRFWHTPQLKVLWCLFRRWCSINWLFLAKVCWQYSPKWTDVFRAERKRQLDRADVSHTCSFNK